jgi:5'-nucleotidase
MDQPLLLLTNDDGIRAPGLSALARALEPLGKVLVVAPDRERSGSSHALTVTREVRYRRLHPGWYEVDGTPTDCVNVGLMRLARRPVALVASGINAGLNIGDHVTYSGTVAGALEGRLLGVPSLAVSQQHGPGGVLEFGASERATRRLARHLLERPLSGDTFLNVNVPAGQPRGMRVTRQGRRDYRPWELARADSEEEGRFRLEEAPASWRRVPEGDHAAIHEGWISVTPLHQDLTDRDALAGLADWMDGARREDRT